MAEHSDTQYAVQRRSRRVKMVKPLKVRPSEVRDDHFEDLPTSVNVSKEGIYFRTRRADYYKGMRVFVTFPYSRAYDPMNLDYVAEVVRMDPLPNNRFGVAVNLLMTMKLT